MLEALIVLTVVEVVLLLAVVALYLLVIMRRLRAVAELLGRIAFGVRAIEQQVANTGPFTSGLNQRLANLSETLGAIEQAAQ